ncbi:hypothetical protein [Ottowia oryzae]|uniref:Uncharacterized protein n=1 Tax=Ottowia oryzae TaxID=2109914 RepID=A0A2S0MB02_9BURK|nr:hypothetical protein [Ottowia oryzae]AVO32971.1 hypothetical protein C6570_00880 [Ottowia oryzae]
MASTFPQGTLDEGALRVQRKRLITAVSAALVLHAIVLAALAMPSRIKLGIDQTAPVVTRWIDAPTVPSPGLARQDPTADQRSTPKAEAPTRPKDPTDRTQPTPRPARNDDQSAAVATAATPAASDAAAASPLPEGQDPLRMLPTTPERFQMLDRLSRDIGADPALFVPGNAVSVTIDLDGKPKVWRFVIVGEELIRSLSGLDVTTLRLLHYPESDRDDKVEVWLVPQLAYRPVQISVTPPGALTSFTNTARVALDQLDQAARSHGPAPGASAPDAPAAR